MGFARNDFLRKVLRGLLLRRVKIAIFVVINVVIKNQSLALQETEHEVLYHKLKKIFSEAKIKMAKAQELGKFAEDIAAEYILSLGWKVIARNVKNQHGELDIIAADSSSKPQELVIIEVRCRTIGKVQSPFDSIGPKKLNALIKSSRNFIDEIEWQNFWRIDIIGIIINDQEDKNDWELKHIRDITAGMNVLS